MNGKIAVLATGANGSCISADLVDAGLDVTMIDQWPAHVEAMRRNGLTIHAGGETRNRRVEAHHLCDVCTLNETFDVVLLTSKAYDSRWLTEFIKPYLSDHGVLVAAQNGMTAEMIGDIVGRDRTVGCVVELASQMFEPGEVTRSTVREKTWFGIGAFDPVQRPHLATVAEVLGHAGTVEVTDDVLSAKWMKLIVNAMTMGMKAVLGTTNEQVFRLDGVRELFLRSGEEALAAGQSRGYEIVPIFGLKPENVRNTNSLLETLLEKIVHDVGPKAINTVLQDFMKGRYSEIDLINGLVTEESRRRGAPAPVNEAIVEVARRISRGELKPDPANLAIIRERSGS